MGYERDYKDLTENEIVRRLVIGLNDQIELEKRRSYLWEDISLQFLVNNVKGFKFCTSEAYSILRWIEQKENRTVIDCTQCCYPSFEGLTKHLPAFLIIEGKVPEPKQPIFAFVGTRRPDYMGLQQAFQLGFESSLNGISCVSGLAEGIDQAGMRGCLKAQKAPCYGVLACGHNFDYPALTGPLKAEIVEKGGAIISRFSPDTPSYKSNFVSRNMIIAAFSRAIVAIQAPKRSGTLITSDYAISMNKDVFVASSGVGDSPCKEGTSNLAYEGAPVLSSLADLNALSEYGVRYDIRLKATAYPVEVLKTPRSKAVRFGDKWYEPTAVCSEQNML